VEIETAEFKVALKPPEEIVGKTFGRWQVVSIAENPTFVNCRCLCGKSERRFRAREIQEFVSYQCVRCSRKGMSRPTLCRW
jgi:hypothetical protein